MRYAIISDIHANQQAWKATLLDIRSLGSDGILCLGDLVGYGPAPAAVLESIYENVDHVVLGNHDAAVCGRMDPCHFNDGARRIVDWTRHQLNEDALAFLQQLPLTLKAGQFACSHGDMAEPGRFNYVIDPADALPSWKCDPSPMIFVGHSHDPAIFVTGPSGTPHRVAPQDFMMEENKRYIVNVGSVGQPRDGDARVSYCLFDTEEKTITWRRLPFDLDAYRADMQAANLDTATSYFLGDDPRLKQKPIRELLSFAPPEQGTEAVPGEALDITVAKLTRKARAWRGAATAMALGATLLLGTGAVLSHRHATRRLVIDATGQVLAPPQPPCDISLLHPLQRTPESNTLSGWNVSLGNHRVQQLTPQTHTGQLHLASRDADAEIRIVHRAIPVLPGMKFCLRAQFKRLENFRGDLGTWVVLLKQEGGRPTRIDPFTSKQPNLRRKEGWLEARETFTIPTGATAIEVGIRGTFSGEANLRDISLHRTQ